MTDVFISYSRTDKDRVAQLARAIEAEGYAVWWDAELPPHQSYGEVITAKIESAKAALVVWSPEAAASEWVRAEADAARNQKKLIQTALTDIIPPLPFNQIQCADLSDWNGDTDHPGWRKVKESLVALCGMPGRETAAPASAETAPAKTGPMPDAGMGAPASAPPPQAAGLYGAPQKSGGSNKAAIIFGSTLGVLALGAIGVTVMSMGNDDDDNAGVAIVDGNGSEETGIAPLPTPSPTASPTQARVENQAQGEGDGLNRDVSLVNKSGETIMYLYWSNVNEEFWGDDRLGSEVLPDGESWFVTVQDNSGACAFDMLGVTASGREIVRPNVNVCAVYEVSFD